MSDRERFLARIRERQGPPPVDGPHPPPPPPDVVPEMRYRNLDGVPGSSPEDLIDVFAEAIRAADASVYVTDESGLDEVLARIVADSGAATAVVSREPEAVAVTERLSALGVSVGPYTPSKGALADLGVTSATLGIAATGSVVVDSSNAGSRAVSLLPRVHLCVLPVERIVATPSRALRNGDGSGLPGCRVIVTGPSRTGDIEQRLTLGAHGPEALHVVVLTGSAP